MFALGLGRFHLNFRFDSDTVYPISLKRSMQGVLLSGQVMSIVRVGQVL